MIYWIKHYIGVFGAILIMVGFCYSRIFMSVGTFLLFLQPFFWYTPKNLGRAILSNKGLWLFLVYFLLQALAIFYTDNIEGYWNNLRVLLPFLLIPVGLLANHFYSRQVRYLIVGCFILSVFSTGVLSFGHYVLNYDAINEQISKSHVVPIITGVNHIYYSVMLAFGIILGTFALCEKWCSKKYQQWILGIVTFINLIFLHIFTARTGLGGFYLSMVVVVLIILLRAGKWLKALAGIGILGIFGVLAIAFVPSLNNKYHNTLTDLNVYLEGKNPNHYSITMRMEAWEKTWYLIQKNPIIGVGPGDLSSQLDKAYEEKGTLLTEENRKDPHNQFLQNFAGLGLPGLFITLGFFVFPFFIANVRVGSTGMAFLVLMVFAFCFESMLERQTGVTFFSFFFCLLFSHQSSTANGLKQEEGRLSQ